MLDQKKNINPTIRFFRNMTMKVIAQRINQAKGNKQKLFNLIMSYKGELSDNDIALLLVFSKDMKKMAKLIIQYKGKNLSDDDVHWLLYYTTKRNQIAKIRGDSDWLNSHPNFSYVMETNQIAKIIEDSGWLNSHPNFFKKIS